MQKSVAKTVSYMELTTVSSRFKMLIAGFRKRQDTTSSQYCHYSFSIQRELRFGKFRLAVKGLVELFSDNAGKAGVGYSFSFVVFAP